MATSQIISAPYALPANFQPQAHNSSHVIRPQDEVVAAHPKGLRQTRCRRNGLYRLVCDYEAGYGPTLDAAWADALYVITNDLLTHDRLAAVQ
jgi:hypothetical protein